MAKLVRGFGLFGALAILLGMLPALAAAAPREWSTELAPVGDSISQDAAASPEQQLIDTYAPIIGLKDQKAPCDENGEPFYPVSVDVVFGKDDVLLKRANGTSSANDEVVKSAPTAQDLYAKGSDYYLDLPGNPRRPGCSYEQWFDANSDGFVPTTYAHIVANGVDKLAIQYWFYYVFNNFNNTHESDWEMIQIVFDVGTVDAALQTDPISVVAAQHGGGETADWDAKKLEKDGNHPIVYSAAGSHATQYGQVVYLGWGENGTGFGCDITTPDSTLVPLQATLLPSTEPDPAGEFAWMNFTGRWGERQGGEYNGPTGPATKRVWKSPFLWESGQRESSIEVPIARTFGPAPATVFCNLSTWGSSVFRLIGDEPAVFLSAVVALLTTITLATRYVWPTVKAAAGVYRKQWRTFILIGLLLIPVGILFNGFNYLVSRYPPGSTVVDVIGHTPGTYYALALLTLITQLLASLIVVGPMVMETYDAITREESISFRQAWSRTQRHVPGLFKVVGLVALIVVALSVTVILVPVAIWLMVRWAFVSASTVLDDVGTKEAMRLSSQSVQQRWWRVAVVLLCLMIVAVVPGAVVGLGLLVFGEASVRATNVVSSLLYVVSVPLSILGVTLLYRRRDLTPKPFGWVRRLFARLRGKEVEHGAAAPAAGD